VDEASKVTAGRGSKKVEAYHLFVPLLSSMDDFIILMLYYRKHAVETTEMLDFLKEIVEAVPDPSAGGTIDLESVDAESAKKKRGKGKRAGTSSEAGTKRRRKKKGVDGEVPGNMEGEVKSDQEPEPEADAAMDEDEDDDDRGPDHGGYSGGARYMAKGEAEDDQWKEDAPYLPRR
jgi:hypothetical protein